MLNGNQEVFVLIPGFGDRYQISNLGTVINSQKPLRTYTNNTGYLALKLCSDTGVRHYLVHRLVAETFLPRVPGKNVVNHIDGNKQNNRWSNLEWVTTAENLSHARQTGLTIYNRPSTGKRLGKTSRYANVLWDSTRKKWIGVVRHNKKNWYAKRFDTEEQAAHHVNWIIQQLGLTDRIINQIP